MPNYPQPSNKWLSNTLGNTAATARTASVVKAQLLSNAAASAEGGSFTPTAANAWQQPTGGAPTVSATIGASGLALIIGSAVVYVPSAPTLAQLAFSYSWTPTGSTPDTVGPNAIGGPSPTTEIARFGYSGGTGGQPLYSTMAGVQTFSGLPKSALVTFSLWYRSENGTGAVFQEVDLTVLPM